MEGFHASKLYELPVPGTATGDVHFRSLGQDCKMTFPCYPDESDPFDLTIAFQGVQAFRHVSDIFYSMEQLEAYDSVVEVHRSAWLQEVLDPDTVKQYSLGEYRHYMFFLDSDGCFEFIARRFTTGQQAHTRKIS